MMVDVDPVLLAALDDAGLTLSEACRHLGIDDGDVEDPVILASPTRSLSRKACNVLYGIRLIPTSEPVMLIAKLMPLSTAPANPVTYDSRCDTVGEWGRRCVIRLTGVDLPETILCTLVGRELREIIRHPAVDLPGLKIAGFTRRSDGVMEIEARSALVERPVDDADMPMELMGEVIVRRSDAQEKRLSRQREG